MRAKSIQEYDIISGLTCEECGTEEDVTYDEMGMEICVDCLFYNATMEDAYESSI